VFRKKSKFKQFDETKVQDFINRCKPITTKILVKTDDIVRNGTFPHRRNAPFVPTMFSTLSKRVIFLFMPPDLYLGANCFCPVCLLICLCQTLTLTVTFEIIQVENYMCHAYVFHEAAHI